MLYSTLFNEDNNKNDEYCGLKLNVFHIERLFIKEEYRSQGIGTKVLERLNGILNYYLNFEVGCYVLLPNPIDRNEKGYLETIKDDKLNNQ